MNTPKQDSTDKSRKVVVTITYTWTFDTDLVWRILPEDATDEEAKEFCVDMALNSDGPDWDTLDAQAEFVG